MAKNPRPAPPAADAPTSPGNKPKSAGHPAFIFIGDAKGDGPDEITAFGLTFEKRGDAVEVADTKAAKKLAANSHFKAA